jgi:hypothetical protein
MNLVKQDGTHDCAMACLAMLLGYKTATALYPMLGRNPSEGVFKGVTKDEVLEILNIYDVTYTYSAVKEASRLPNLPSPLLSVKEAMEGVHRDKNGTYMLGVPSLNHQNDWHFIVLHKGEIFDPSNGNCYIGSDVSLSPDCVIKIVKGGAVDHD